MEENRILIYAPIGKDAVLTSTVLESAGVSCFICHNFHQTLQELDKGAAALLTVEEALPPAMLKLLAEFVAGQPTWSDLPILLLTQHGVNTFGVDDAVEKLGNLTLLDRPIRTASLISAARAALRARQRQYQVREADKRKDEFLASLAHELRNPLAPIRTSMGILKYLYPEASGVTQVREVVERQVTHLTRLVDDLLDVARITSGKVDLRLDFIVLSAVIEHAVEICAPLLKNAQQKIEVAQPPHEIYLRADHARVVQSLANILSNAIKFSTEPGTIFFNAEVEGVKVIFRIKDQGIGMEAAALSKIFDMFAQAESSKRRALGGLGIGLSLAKRFTEMHGGTIEARSEGIGKGSEFILTLPVVTQKIDRDKSEQSANAVQAAQPACQRVLVVDDNRDAADSLQVLLQAAGFEVSTAYDGQEAVDAVQMQQPDIVVMDIGMPGVDGYEAVRRIRTQPGGKDILMIALTGWGQESARRKAAEAGYDHHLVKPVDMDVLKCLVMRAA